ncbi:MAG TPA: FecR family protein [Rectinemataceae bacterium]|nr:FecR family protein [Rectinemataceae bacterium]
MKRLLTVAVLIMVAIGISALEAVELGRIDYIEGGVTISRAGRTLSAPNIDDPLLSGDLIRTASDGQVVIAMDKSTGMRGTVTVRPKSTLYLKLDQVKGEPRTTVDLLAGSMGSKVSKIAGAPTVNVVTDSSVMGVRGTEYGVAVSVNDNTLVTCVEGSVSVSDGTQQLPVPAGHALEKQPGERLRLLPVAVSSVQQFTERWIADEIEAFKADPVRALSDYAKRYNDLADKFAKAYAPFQNSPTPRKWAEEDRTGVKINPMDPTVLREKKEIAGYLLNIRKVLFLFERIYYRVDELSDLVAGTAAEKSLIAPGMTAGDFLASVKADQDRLAAEVSRYRYIESLYAARDTEGGVFGGEDDFFNSSDGF